MKAHIVSFINECIKILSRRKLEGVRARSSPIEYTFVRTIDLLYAFTELQIRVGRSRVDFYEYERIR